MGKQRDKIDLLADVLKVAGDGSNKTRIMYCANMSYGILLKYLELALENELLVFNGQKYSVSKKGSAFLEKYLAFCDRRLKAQTMLNELETEKQMIGNLLSEKTISPTMPFENKTQETKVINEPVDFGSETGRISQKEFYIELCQLGFNSSQAFEIASWLGIICASKPAFFSRKKAVTVKTCLAYIGGKVLSKPRVFTQNKIAAFYHLHYCAYICKFYRTYLTILRDAKPELFTNKNLY